MRESKLDAIKRRKETYGCDGQCGTCMGIDICEETRNDEGFAELLILILIVAAPISLMLILLYS